MWILSLWSLNSIFENSCIAGWSTFGDLWFLQVASQFLNEHIASVCAENQALRNELNILMDQHKELNIKKHQLSEKHKELLRQLRVQQDLARLYIDAGPADTAGEGFGTSAVEVVSTAKMGQTQGGHRESERAAIAGKAGFLPQLQGGRSVTTT